MYIIIIVMLGFNGNYEYATMDNTYKTLAECESHVKSIQAYNERLSVVCNKKDK
jgi:hypothetical protein